MKQQIPKKLTVMIDDREKNDLVFPKSFIWNRGREAHLIQLPTRKVGFDTGDYYLDGYKEHVIVERKGSLSELQQNLLTKDEVRFRKAIRRLVAACRVPILWLDIPQADLWEPTPYVDDPHRVIDKLLKTCQEFGLQLWWVPPAGSSKFAYRNGELLVRTMWSIIQSPPKGVCSDLNFLSL